MGQDYNSSGEKRWLKEALYGDVPGESCVRKAEGDLSRGIHRAGRLFGPLRRIEFINHRRPCACYVTPDERQL